MDKKSVNMEFFSFFGPMLLAFSLLFNLILIDQHRFYTNPDYGKLRVVLHFKMNRINVDNSSFIRTTNPAVLRSTEPLLYSSDKQYYEYWKVHSWGDSGWITFVVPYQGETVEDWEKSPVEYFVKRT